MWHREIAATHGATIWGPRIMVRWVTALLLCTATAAQSQNVSFDAVKLAEAVMATSWKNAEENVLPAVLLKIETDLTVLKWMMGVQIAGVASSVIKAFA